MQSVYVDFQWEDASNDQVSHLECKLHQSLIITGVVYKECLLQILQGYKN